MREVGVGGVADEVLAVLVRDVLCGGLSTVALFEPGAGGLVAGVVACKLEVVLQQLRVPWEFVVGEVSEKPRVVLGGGELPGMAVAEFGEFRVEDERAVAGVSGVAGFPIGAAALLAVGRHEVPDLGVNETALGGAEERVVTPCAEAVESVVFQQRGGGRGPALGRAEQLPQAFLRAGRGRLADRRDTAVDEQVAVGIDEPPAAAGLGGAEEAGRFGETFRIASEAAAGGIGGKVGQVGQGAGGHRLPRASRRTGDVHRFGQRGGECRPWEDRQQDNQHPTWGQYHPAGVAGSHRRAHRLGDREIQRQGIDVQQPDRGRPYY